MNLNRAIIVGRVTQDPQLRTTPSGQSVSNFSVATNRNWTDAQTHERHEKTEFHNIVAWRRLAEIAHQYLTKGSLVMVEGRIETRSWNDQSGNKRYRTEIVAENMQLGPRPSYTASPSEAMTGKNASHEVDEIPTIESDEPIAQSGSSETENSEEGEINVKDIPF